MSFLLVIFLTFIALCNGDGNGENKELFPNAKIVEAVGRDHVVIGSFGVWSAIIMLTYGYSNMWKLVSASSRANLITNYIEFRDPILSSEPKVEMRLTNFVFKNNDFNILPEFRDVFIRNFGAHVSSHNFGNSIKTSNEVNEIISKEVNMKEYFRPSDFKDLSMIIANVFEFKAPWSNPFRRSETTVETVNDAAGQHTLIMMHKTMQVPFTSVDEIKANVMELPFGDTEMYSMLVIKPHSGVHIAETVKLLRAITLRDLMYNVYQEVIRSGLIYVDVTLPKCRITNWLELNKPLSDIGLNDFFNSESSHFPGISKEQVYVSSFEYEAYIMFDEEGVQAMSSTPGRSSNAFAVSPPTAAVAEPFVFFIFEKNTMSALFIGIHSKA